MTRDPRWVHRKASDMTEVRGFGDLVVYAGRDGFLVAELGHREELVRRDDGSDGFDFVASPDNSHSPTRLTALWAPSGTVLKISECAKSVVPKRSGLVAVELRSGDTTEITTPNAGLKLAPDSCALVKGVGGRLVIRGNGGGRGRVHLWSGFSHVTVEADNVSLTGSTAAIGVLDGNGRNLKGSLMVVSDRRRHRDEGFRAIPLDPGEFRARDEVAEIVALGGGRYAFPEEVQKQLSQNADRDAPVSVAASRFDRPSTLVDRANRTLDVPVFPS